eukprot:1619560-Pleurochrysis_carterae.AAC.4
MANPAVAAKDNGVCGKRRKKPTSWQRRRSKSPADSRSLKVAMGKEERKLITACADAKSASWQARERHRLKLPAEDGDADLVAAYQSARVALQTFRDSKPQVPPKRAAHASQQKESDKAANETKDSEGASGSPADSRGAVLLERTRKSSRHGSGDLNKGHERMAPLGVVQRRQGKAAAPVLMSAELLGVDPKERRMAKKAARRAERKAKSARVKEMLRRQRARRGREVTGRKEAEPDHKANLAKRACVGTRVGIAKTAAVERKLPSRESCRRRGKLQSKTDLDRAH